MEVVNPYYFDVVKLQGRDTVDLVWCADVRGIKDVFYPLNFIYCWLTLYFTFSFFLLDPAFVGSAYIQESLPKGNPVGDDDKIYFFFSEAGKEFDFFDNTIVSRIARVCKVRDAFGQIVHLKGAFFFPLQ